MPANSKLWIQKHLYLCCIIIYVASLFLLLYLYQPQTIKT